MGGNAILLLRGDMLPPEDEINVTNFLVKHVGFRADEVGIVRATQVPRTYSVNIIFTATMKYITMCGGLTQVLGRAVLDHALGIAAGPGDEILLTTGAGKVRIRLPATPEEGVWTDMSAFVAQCYSLGLEECFSLEEEFAGIRVFKVGKFLVADVTAGSVNVLDDQTYQLLGNLQTRFNQRYFPEQPSWNFALFDRRAAAGSWGRCVFPHIATDRVCEPSCGTGSVAIAMAGAHWYRLGGSEVTRNANVVLECGSLHKLGGTQHATVRLGFTGGAVSDCWFSHSTVEVRIVGTAILHRNGEAQTWAN